jgi:hypothetical protein
MKGSARQLGELIYALGFQRAEFEAGLAKKTGEALAKAFDDGFVLGRETGLKDAAEADAQAKKKDPLLLS